MKGFTLIEVLLVMAIIGLLGYLTLPVGIEFYRFLQLDSTADGLVQSLRRAHIKSTSQEAGTSFGIYISNGQYTLFKGDTYASRDVSYDENFAVDSSISFRGLNEVTFAQLTGQPSAYGNILLSNSSDELAVNINAMGTIALKLPVFNLTAIYPQSSGDTNQLRRNNCTENWQCIDDTGVGDDDTTYVYAWRRDSRYDLYNITDPFISLDENIFQLTIYFNCRRSVSGDPTMSAASYLLTNGSTVEGATQILTDSYLIYSEAYLINPVTSNAWTLNEVNSLQAGLHLVASTNQDSNQSRCTQVWAEIEHVSYE